MAARTLEGKATHVNELTEIAQHFLLIVLSVGVVALWFEVTYWISRK